MRRAVVWRSNGDQRDVPLPGSSDKSGCPNIRRKRFARGRELRYLEDSARSPGVNGRASCSLAGSDVRSGDGRGPAGPEVELVLSWRGSIQGRSVLNSGPESSRESVSPDRACQSEVDLGPQRESHKPGLRRGKLAEREAR